MVRVTAWPRDPLLWSCQTAAPAPAQTAISTPPAAAPSFTLPDRNLRGGRAVVVVLVSTVVSSRRWRRHARAFAEYSVAGGEGGAIAGRPHLFLGWVCRKVRSALHVSRGDEAVAEGVGGGFRPAMCPDLGVQVRDVPLDGAVAADQCPGDLACALARGDEAQHLDLSCGQLMLGGCRLQSNAAYADRRHIVRMLTCTGVRCE